MHADLDGVEPGIDRFWGCARKGCRTRPLYVPAGVIIDIAYSGDPELDARALRAKRRGEHPRRLSEEQWAERVAKWTRKRDQRRRAAAAGEAAEAERRAAAERTRAELRAATQAAAESWACPEHGTDRILAGDWSGSWTASCRVGDCQRGYPPVPTLDPELLAVEDPDGWQCPQHGLQAITKVRWSDELMVRTCTWCDEIDAPADDAPLRLAASRVASPAAGVPSTRPAHQAGVVKQARIAAPRKCAHCGSDEGAHGGADHQFDGSRLAHAKNTVVNFITIAGFIVAIYAFFASATTPGAPFHEITAPLLCFWDWKGTACG
jgi:hypothetical protein